MADTESQETIDRRATEPGGGQAMNRPKARTLKPLALLLPYAGRHWRTVAVALVFLVGAAALSLTLPILLGRAADSGQQAGGDAQKLLELVDRSFFWVAAAAIASGVLGAVRFYFVSRFGERIAADLRRDLYAHLLTLGPRYHAKMRSGEAVSRLTADITLIEQFLGTSASMATRTLITTFGALTMMLVVNWQLGLTLLAMLPVAMLPVVGVGRIIRTMSNRAQSRLADAGAEAAEALDAIELVQAYSREESRLANFTEAVEATFAAAMRRITARAFMIVMVSVLLFGGFVCVLWMGARAVATGEMSFGDLSAMVLYALYAGSGFGMLAEVYGEVMRAAGAADRAAEVLNAEPEIAPPARPRQMPEKVTGALSFDHVTFAYDEATNDGKPVSALTDFSLTVKPGEFVALVGPSGAGKTTVFRLALRLFDPQSGKVTLDGVASAEALPADWRRNFSYAPQESALFTGTAAENIGFGTDNPDEKLFEHAARMAEAMEFLSEKEGLATPLGQKGRNLSGGQRQRIALARALVRDAPVLLLDEATSALDSESEAAVRRAIENASEGRTTLVIAHRLSTVRRADRIVVMEHGQIAEEGSHEELVAKGGLYARLAELQFAEG
ncbi:ABC transporter transmembrane domain-containing protein [uncultured Hyphomonas sp.]|uniref:ABC transporter ATP-binding protein n=1 Tax=uncultured Hyphomonas sp. TaxID=225298 RepID=UPI002AAB2264|nr:ABC transporter transmembrane domain-containing protein [uncultured Hyphomonas sp.]